jgi:hypothetical protein
LLKSADAKVLNAFFVDDWKTLEWQTFYGVHFGPTCFLLQSEMVFLSFSGAKESIPPAYLLAWRTGT